MDKTGEIFKHLLHFDDPGADDNEPVKGITMGDIRAWHDRYESLFSAWADCLNRLERKSDER